MGNFLLTSLEQSHNTTWKTNRKFRWLSLRPSEKGWPSMEAPLILQPIRTCSLAFAKDGPLTEVVAWNIPCSAFSWFYLNVWCVLVCAIDIFWFESPCYSLTVLYSHDKMSDGSSAPNEMLGFQPRTCASETPGLKCIESGWFSLGGTQHNHFLNSENYENILRKSRTGFYRDISFWDMRKCRNLQGEVLKRCCPLFPWEWWFHIST